MLSMLFKDVIVDALYDLLTYYNVTSLFFLCDISAAFSICDDSPLQHFLSCTGSVILARSLLECSLIGC